MSSEPAGPPPRPSPRRVRGRTPADGELVANPEREGPRLHPALRLLNVGYGNLVLVSRVVAIVSPQSSPMKRLRDEAGSRGKLVDATQGRRTRSILVTDSDHVILSALNPDTLASRLGPGTPVDPGP